MGANSQPQQARQLFPDFSCLATSRHLKILFIFFLFSVEEDPEKMKFVHVSSKS